MTLKWMADRLKMGTWTLVANRLYHLKSEFLSMLGIRLGRVFKHYLLK